MNTKIDHNMKRAAFSILELGIVITIIATLLAGVTVAQNLADNAKLNKIIISLKEIDESIASFKMTYESIPGDFANATSYFSGTANGDGDGQIEDRETVTGNVRESLRAWQHLSLAKTIVGNFNGTGSTLIGGVNIPSTNRDGVVMNFSYEFWNSNNSWTNSNYLENALHIGGILTTSSFYGVNIERVIASSFSSFDAKRLDEKFDDNARLAGKFLWVGGRSAGDGSWDICPVFTAVDHNITCILVKNLGKL